MSEDVDEIVELGFNDVTGNKMELPRSVSAELGFSENVDEKTFWDRIKSKPLDLSQIKNNQMMIGASQKQKEYHALKEVMKTIPQGGDNYIDVAESSPCAIRMEIDPLNAAVGGYDKTFSTKVQEKIDAKVNIVKAVGEVGEELFGK